MSGDPGTIGAVLEIPQDQHGEFIRGFSIGLIVGSAIGSAYYDPRAGIVPPAQLARELIVRNREKWFHGLKQPLSDEVINAMIALLQAQNEMMFLNNIIYR
jgi:hypothetical protein